MSSPKGTLPDGAFRLDQTFPDKVLGYLKDVSGDHHHKLAAYIQNNSEASSQPRWNLAFHTRMFPAGHLAACAFYQPVREAMPAVYAPPPSALSPEAFYIGQSPLGGRGLFASRDIPTGSAIIVEHPSMVQPILGPFLYGGIALPNFNGVQLKGGPADLIRMLLSVLPIGQAAEFGTLSNCHPPETYEREDGIFRTNAMGIDLDVPPGKDQPFEQHGAVFLRISRCNHSCGPNASYVWSKSSFSMTLYSTRRIAKGEEITISYVGTEQSRAERHHILKSMYHFDCTCPFCALKSESAIAKSDARRQEIADYRSGVSMMSYEDWVVNPDVTVETAMQPYVHLLMITEKEGMHDHGSRLGCAKTLMNMTAAVEDEVKYRYWATKLLSAFLAVACEHDLKNGQSRSKETTDQARIIVEASQNPRSDIHWGERRKRCGRARN